MGGENRLAVNKFIPCHTQTARGVKIFLCQTLVGVKLNGLKSYCHNLYPEVVPGKFHGQFFPTFYFAEKG